MEDWDVRLATRAGGCGPMTWGLRHPVVLLPMRAALWPRERLEAVLLHEFAHVRRGDAFARTVSRIACALYWPNPLVWQAARRLRDEAEIAADDAVLEANAAPPCMPAPCWRLRRNGAKRGASPWPTARHWNHACNRFCLPSPHEQE